MPSPERPDKPPTVTPQRAIELLKRQVDQIENLKLSHRKSPEVKRWESTTEGVLDAAFGFPNGEQHKLTLSFKYPIQRAYSPRGRAPSDSFWQRCYHEDMDKRRAILGSCIEQLEILAPPGASVAALDYRFHADVERVSAELFRGAHYKQAVLEAYILVINEVKRRSGLVLDGEPLMNRAFGCNSQTPVLQFNSMSTAAEVDEQRGIMYLFKGIVALRNCKAHSNTLFDDPNRAHDYLALASLLMRLLEIAERT